MHHGATGRSLSPPRPANLSSVIQRIEDRRAMAARAAADGAASSSSIIIERNHSPHQSPPPPQGRGPHLHQVHTTPNTATTTPGRGGSVYHPSMGPVVPGAYTPQSSATEVSLLRLEVHQKQTEVDMKKKTILKLEGDHLRLLEELEGLRKAESEKRDAQSRQHREDLRKERDVVEQLQQQLSAEVTRRGQAERNAIGFKEAKAHAEGLEEQLSIKGTLLQDRERDLDAALDAKRQLEAQLVELERSDQSNVLRGRLAVLEERLEASNEQLQGMQTALMAEEKRRKDSDTAMAEAIRYAEEKGNECFAQSTNVADLQSTVQRHVAEIQRLYERIDGLQTQLAEREESFTKQTVKLEEEADASRADVRKRMQQIYQLETHVAELQQQLTTGQDALHALEGSMKVQQGELSSVLDRLRNSHQAVEERETELSKLNVVVHDQKTQMASLRAQVETLQTEVDAAHRATRVARDELGEANVALSQRAGAEERLAVSRKAQAALEEELFEEQRAARSVREKYAVAEQQLAQARHDLAHVPELERQIAKRDEALHVAQSDAKVGALREASLKDDVAALREKLHVADTKWTVELERREEVERKLRVLEDAAQSSYGVFGKYAALQQYLSTATSEASKSLELNNALLEEIKTMEVANRDLQTRFDQLQEEKRLLVGHAAEASVYKADLERALLRAREAEERERDLTLLRRNDPLQRRVAELEQNLVEAIRRATSAESDLHVLRGQRGAAVAIQSTNSSHQMNRDATPGADASPIRIDDDVSSESSGDETTPPPSVGAPAAAPVPEPASSATAALEPLPVAAPSPTKREAPPTPKDNVERDALMQQLSSQRDRLAAQDERMEQLSLQFGDALAELRRLKAAEQRQQAPSPSSSPVALSSTRTSASPRAHAIAASSNVYRDSAMRSSGDGGVGGSRASGASMTSPMVLAQRQQRVRYADNTRTPTPPRAAPSARSNLTSPSRLIASRDDNSGALRPLGTPPRVPSPKTARIQQQRASLTESVREKMTLLFKNAREVSLASPSPVKVPPSRTLSPDTNRRLTGVMSPVRFE